MQCNNKTEPIKWAEKHLGLSAATFKVKNSSLPWPVARNSLMNWANSEVPDHTAAEDGVQKMAIPANEPPHGKKNNKMASVPNEDSDLPWHQPSLIRVSVVCMTKAWVLSYLLSTQRRLWSDWADAQADLSFVGRTCHFVGFVMRRLKWWNMLGQQFYFLALGYPPMCRG